MLWQVKISSSGIGTTFVRRGGSFVRVERALIMGIERSRNMRCIDGLAAWGAGAEGVLSKDDTSVMHQGDM